MTLAYTANTMPNVLPQNFYILNQSGPTRMIPKDTQPRVFFIVVGDAPIAPTSGPSTYQTLLSQLAINPPDIPSGFMPQLLATGTTVSLYFNWEDKVGFKSIRDAGKQLAEGISTLLDIYGVPCIIISFYRGSLVVNNASQSWKIPALTTKPTLIQIGTPVPNPVTTYADLMPNPKNIYQLFFFYSKQPFVVDQPTLHPNYNVVYDAIAGLNMYTILVLLNNKQPLQNNLVSPILMQNIIPCCATTHITYRENRDLYLNLSTLYPEINGKIGVNQQRSGKPSALGTQELRLSNAVTNQVQNSLGRNVALDINKGEKLRNTYRSS